MKYLAKTLPLEGKGKWQTLNIEQLRLSIHWPGWKTHSGRNCALVYSDDSCPCGYIGLSRGKNGYHIGSPHNNFLLKKTAKECGWKKIS
jgi:hypothetical protein